MGVKVCNIVNLLYHRDHSKPCVAWPHLQVVDCDDDFTVRRATVKPHRERQGVKHFNIMVGISIHVLDDIRVNDRRDQSLPWESNLARRNGSLAMTIRSLVHATYGEIIGILKDGAYLHRGHSDGDADVHVQVCNGQLPSCRHKYLRTR